MKKQITAIAALLILSTGLASADAIKVVVLDTRVGVIAQQVDVRNDSDNRSQSPAEQVLQLISVGDRFMQKSQYVAAIQVYTRCAVIAHTNRQESVSEQLERKLGAAYWQLAEKENDPGLKNVARAFWSTANTD